MPPPDIRVRGIRTPLPSGYIIGRLSGGTGDAELIDISTLTQHVVATGAVAAPGSIPAGAITSLTGDVTATGPGAAAATLATVNSNVGAFTLASITASAKGLITAAASAVLASTKIWVGNGSSVPTAVNLSGDATLANTGALTLNTVNSNVGSFTNASITVNAKGLVTAASTGSTGSAPNGMLPLVSGSVNADGTPGFILDGSNQCIGVAL
jgi:hypothetical protein